MKIVKSTLFKKVKSDYGNFDFKPNAGFELRSFIDFESKLIVVEESPIKKLPGVPYSPRQFIVDPQKIDFKLLMSFGKVLPKMKNGI